MSKSVHSIELKAVDKTGGAFSSIANNAAAAGGRIRGVLGGAFAAAGAYLSFKAFANGANELGHLSDIAQKTNTSVDDLTSAATALNILGIQNMGIDQLGKAFDYLQKTTGRTGMDGMIQTIGELAKIEDTAKRGQEAMRIFGRSGMEFMPLINAAADGTASLEGVIAAMPRIPQSAADSGDAMADAMAIASDGVKSVWLQCIGSVCGYFDTIYAGGIREAAAQGANWLEYYAKVGVTNAISYWDKMTTFFEGVGTFVGTLFNGEGSFGERWDMAKELMANEFDARGEYLAQENAANEARIAAWKKAADERAATISKLSENYTGAARGKRDVGANANALADVAAKIPKITNSLVMGDSNAAIKMSILGPSLQTESQKQTKLLEQIAENTEKAAEVETEDPETIYNPD